jgi:hypothetical protein
MTEPVFWGLAITRLLAAAPRSCLRTHPSTVTAGMLALGPDLVWLGTP